MQQQPTFEQAFTALTETVAGLEQGGQTLEESLTSFERGIALYRECERMLAAAELRVSRLLDEQAPDLPPVDPGADELAAADGPAADDWG